MNKHYILSLFDEELKTVGATFKGGSQVYTYKTHDTYAVGDFAVVHTPSNGFQVVEITVVHDTPDIDSDSRVDYKWLVQKLDCTGYDKLVKNDEALSSKVKGAQRNAHREAARAALLNTIPALASLNKQPEQTLTPLSNGLAVNSDGAMFHPAHDGSGWTGPFDSVKEAMVSWNTINRAAAVKPEAPVHDV